MKIIKIGILGTGPVGQALAKGFLENNYEVLLGSRTPEKVNEIKKNTGLNVKSGTFADAANFGDIVVLAVKGAGTKDALEKAGPENLKGKIIIDTTNPISDAPPQNGVLKFFTTLDNSLMEELQKLYPSARFVKAFSCVGNANMVNPDFGGIKPTMFICGNDESAKREVSEILVKFGFDVEDMGTVEAARAIEPLCILWCIPGFRENRWTHAFKMLKAGEIYDTSGGSFH